MTLTRSWRFKSSRAHSAGQCMLHVLPRVFFRRAVTCDGYVVGLQFVSRAWQVLAQMKDDELCDVIEYAEFVRKRKPRKG